MPPISGVVLGFWVMVMARSSADLDERSTNRSRGGGRPDRLDDVHVPRAAAEISRDRPTDVVVARVPVLLEQRRGDEHHAGGAEPALQSVFLLEGSLHGM